MTSSRQWYAAKVCQDFGEFKAGETVYVRSMNLKRPLAVGPITVLFNPRQFKSVRVADSLGLHTVYRLWPSNVLPKPAPPDKNDEIEEAYQEYLEAYPVAKRLKRSCE